VNNFIMKLSGHTSAALGGNADCAATAPVLAFDPSTRDRIVATVHDGSGRNPACTRVGMAH
jgi:hypothetical protein